MNFNWFFKGDRNRFDESEFFSDEHDLRNHSKDEEINSYEFPIIEPFGNMEDTTRGFFQHMEDMLNHMFSSSFIPFGSIKIDENTSSNFDPRSVMLKDPGCKNCDECPEPRTYDVNPNNYADNDIDEEVAKHGLILDDSSVHHRPQKFSYRKFSSIRTVHLPDGTLEEHRKSSDGQGNVTTTIRKSIGNQSYEVTTRADSQGIKEKEENFTNLDQREKSEFEKRWLDIKNRKLPIQEPRSDSMLPSSATIGDPSYYSLFKKFFGI